jgi:hypothetical protein
MKQSDVICTPRNSMPRLSRSIMSAENVLLMLKYSHREYTTVLTKTEQGRQERDSLSVACHKPTLANSTFFVRKQVNTDQPAER